MQRRWLWTVVPVVALLELVGHGALSRRAPELAEWKQVVPIVERLRATDDAIVVAPRWAEPFARHVLGDRFWPIRDRARAGLGGAARALELSILGQTDPEIRDWPLLHRERNGAFTVSVRKNPDFRPALFDAASAIELGEAHVFRKHDGTRYDCQWKTHEPPSTGGLHGHVAFPSRRFVCGRHKVEFVGVTIIDDQEYQPRRCVWAHPAAEGQLSIRFEGVRFGRELTGHTGLSYFLMRDGVGAPVVLQALVDGKPIGAIVHRDEAGWVPFTLPTHSHEGKRGRLEFRIRSEQFDQRHFCFSAETR